MTLLILFFIALAVLVTVFVVVILLAGFRPQRSRRSSRGIGDISIRDSGGGTTP